MKRYFIGKICILSCLFAFCFSGYVFADPIIDVKITNRTFTGNTLKFDVELKAGKDYRQNGAADGDWASMNLRLDIYGESGLTYTIGTAPTPTTHDMAAQNVEPNDVSYGVYNTTGAPAGVTTAVSIQAMRTSSNADATKDLGDTFVRLATIEVTVTGGTPTDLTRIKVREDDEYTNINRRAFWGNLTEPTRYRQFHQIEEEQEPEIFMAVDDYVSVQEGVAMTLNVIANDILPSDCTTPVVEILSTPVPTGSVSLSGTVVTYTLGAGQTSDSFRYKITCGTEADTATVYIWADYMPDNIIDANCYIGPQAFEWGIRVDWSSTVLVSNAIIPLVGDLNNDEIPEIVCFGPEDRVGTKPGSDAFASRTILVFDGKTRELLSRITLPSAVTEYDGAPYGLVKTADNKGLIVVASLDYKLRAYDITSADVNVPVWTSDVDYGSVLGDFSANVGFADFNSDGHPEVYVRDKIYDASTGVLLATAPIGSNAGLSWSHWSHSTGWKNSAPIAADITGDGKLELILGNEIYNVTITNRNGIGGNDISLLKRIDPPLGVIPDGHAQVADFNKDGHLDVLITNRDVKEHSANVSIYVWDVHNNKVSTPKNITTDYSGKSIPLIADVDNDGDLEIIIQCGVSGSSEKIHCYKYDPDAMTFSLLWGFSPNENSYSNGATLFDFNQDGKNEVLISDQTGVYIINGSGKSHITGVDTVPMYVMSSLYFGQMTVMQYPVIADVDNDGSAEIIAAGIRSGGANNPTGTLNIFKSSTSPWAPARKVWNQYGYNAVNVNDDLTIPRFQLNPATVFPGSGTPVRPYNNFLQQQTMLNKEGEPFWPAANGQIVSNSLVYNYDAASDSITITLDVYNDGDAALQDPFYITAYKNSIGNSPSYTYVYNDMIYNGETATITFGIPNFKTSWHTSDFTNLVVQINDNGNGYNHQAVCDSAYRNVKTSNILASDDRYLVFKDSLNNRLNVAFNDLYPCANPTIEVISGPNNGSLGAVNSSGITYSPSSGYVGGDTLRYRIYCDDTSKADTAIVYISIIEKPDNLSDANCVIEPIGTEFSFNELIRSSENIYTVVTPLCGDIDGDGLVEIIVAANGNVSANGICIFKVHRDNTMTLQQTIATPNYVPLQGAPYAIANVDGGTHAAIFLATSDNNGAANKMQLIKYTFDGTEYTESARQTYSTTSKRQAPNPTIVDFNHDGIPEVLVYDKVYNARTMELLVDGGYINDDNMGFGEGAHPNENISSSSLLAVADVDGDGTPEVIGGNCVYKVTINNPNGTEGNSFVLWSKCDRLDSEGNIRNEAFDGATSVADFDGDGLLDIVVSVPRHKNLSDGARGALYIWNPRTGKVMNTNIINDIMVHSANYQHAGASIAFVGDIDNDGEPEICITSRRKMHAFRYNKETKEIETIWEVNTNDNSAATTMVLFDFNQDGENELVYRDETHLRIIDKNGQNLIDPIPCGSWTGSECPIVADVNGDGAAEIIVTGTLSGPNWEGGHLRIFSSNPMGLWAPARRVWNQFSYNVVNVNDDLTIPRFQLNPATVFPGADGILGTEDDVRPYNNFLQQQTILSKDGTPFWPVPDAIIDQTLSNITTSGDIAIIEACFNNMGDAPIGSPVFATLYSDSISATSIITVDSANIQVGVGESGCVTVKVHKNLLLDPAHTPINIIVRINDRNGAFEYQPECDMSNNVMSFINPFLMRKEATLLITPEFKHNGTYPNPVSVLHGEEIRYEITAINVTPTTTNIVVTDTIPAYLKYVTGSVSSSPAADITDDSGSTTPPPYPVREVIKWTFNNVTSGDSVKAIFKATPVSGASASQPLFTNYAWVRLSNLTQVYNTNSTFHQGAGISIMTFSAGLGGSIYNASEQALDYMTTPRSGILVVPDEGYEFAGWSHSGYTSLRGAAIKAQDNIIYYDTLTVYGNVELYAVFEPIKESLNEEDEEVEPMAAGVENKVWSVEDELFITTTKAGSIVRVYTLEGILREQHTIVSAGTTSRKLSRGIYIVTINNDIGQKIRIE